MAENGEKIIDPFTCSRFTALPDIFYPSPPGHNDVEQVVLSPTVSPFLRTSHTGLRTAL